ncbi:hypothetical protein BB558_003451 [Smittium angustum]|uniref:G-protein coupled receptors family 2 profile 2 domain-containing protein n=1 Tax=Smittium angustum TaxID=133377 RepID=A0A2U1J5Z7_SMIAN|nr:hypothetical protein BB558_003451 [Smittium angustum]
MDPKFSIPPENAGMITFDAPYLQYWPNPSTAYGCGSGFVLLSILLFGSSILYRNKLYAGSIFSCLAFAAGLFLRGSISIKTANTIEIYQASIAFEYISFYILVLQTFTFQSRWVLYSFQNEKYFKVLRYLSVYNLVSSTFLTIIGVLLVFNGSAIIRGSGFCIMMSALTNNILVVFYGLYTLINFMRTKERRKRINRIQVFCLVLPQVGTFCWSVSRYVFWTKPQTSRSNAGEVLYYIMGPIFLFLIVVALKCVKAHKQFLVVSLISDLDVQIDDDITSLKSSQVVYQTGLRLHGGQIGFSGSNTNNQEKIYGGSESKDPRNYNNLERGYWDARSTSSAANKNKTSGYNTTKTRKLPFTVKVQDIY